MISQTNHPLRSNQGSALIVTILLISVMLAASLILLQRIIPYAKNVRSMNDSAQAYYTARGELEAGRFGFLHKGGISRDIVNPNPAPGGDKNEDLREYRGDRKSGDASDLTIGRDITNISHDPIDKLVSLALPTLTTAKPNTYVVSSVDSSLPLKVKLFAADTAPVLLGTSKTNPAYHTLNPWNSGGLRFDLRGVKTGELAFGLTITFPGTGSLAGKNLSLKMQYADATTTKTFTNSIPLGISRDYILSDTTSPGPATGNIQIISSGVITAENNKTLRDFLKSTPAKRCNDTGVKTCDLNLSIDGAESVDFQLTSQGISGYYIPDLNAVVIGDGLSNNGLYFQRVIGLIPTIQDI